ncbi:hypothetical protein CROQUDRAFT_104986 [Cronartium quercuum f. sp. fusiforme G11]|uniref:HCP-like protein n=1 Tax=Cronartium quercuum f. sp. fusiforme G11 TaxID=708437 RepID=A0A9P6NQ69_9BASI|nr:hypothetical protein CROQUDRAFT_104986 [Cronartium quercuum f. sp. fusiforme G11]
MSNSDLDHAHEPDRLLQSELESIKNVLIRPTSPISIDDPVHPDQLFWNRPGPSPIRTLTRHSNRSSPALRQVTPIKQAVPPLPTADDLHLDRLRLVDQSFTPPVRNQSQQSQPQDSDKIPSVDTNLTSQSSSVHSIDLDSRSSQSIGRDTISSRPSLSSFPTNQDGVPSPSEDPTTSSYYVRRDSANSQRSISLKLGDSSEKTQIIDLYDHRPTSTSSLPVMTNSGSTEGQAVTADPAHAPSNASENPQQPTKASEEDLQEGYGGMIRSASSSHSGKPHGSFQSASDKPPHEHAHQHPAHVIAGPTSQRHAGPGPTHEYTSSQSQPQPPITPSGYNHPGEPPTTVYRPHYQPYPGHHMDPSSQSYTPHQAPLYANQSHGGNFAHAHPPNVSTSSFVSNPAYAAHPPRPSSSLSQHQLRGVPSGQPGPAFYNPAQAQRPFYQAPPPNHIGIAHQPQQTYGPPAPYGGPGGYADPYAHQQASRGGPTTAGPYAPPPTPQGSFMPGAGLSRSGTSMSNLSTNSRSTPRPVTNAPKPGPTITKASIDEYRNRIKSDPDPEAHFNFAKFLIEAAKKLASGGAAGDDKAIKKYRDSLLSESLKLIKKLATQGIGLGKPAYSDAQFFLANCLGNGSLGLQVDHEKAYNLYVQASKQNHGAATYRTAVCNELGAGTRKDPARAVLFYRKASALGDTAGMYKLGLILLNGTLGQQRNPQEALLWLKRAAQQADEDNPHALHELAQIYENPPVVSIPTTTNEKNGTQKIRGPIVLLLQRDESYARELYTQAAQLGYPPSQNRLGACYEYGALTCPVDPRRSIGWYTKAAEKGDAESELALSGWYLTGSEGVLKQSDSEAYLWARRAANKGLPKAEYAVGYYSEVGIGVKQDLDEAKRWYMRAATNKNKRAMQRLTELKKLGAQKPGKKQARPTRDQAASECVIF